jgi:hypothetical protein
MMHMHMMMMQNRIDNKQREHRDREREQQRRIDSAETTHKLDVHEYVEKRWGDRQHQPYTT